MIISELAEKTFHIVHEYKVTPEVYYSFQRCSDDYNPLHTDQVYAESKGFSGRVMYGNILNAFVSHFVGMLLPTRDVMILTQDINYHKPVYMEDYLVLETSIEEISDAAGYIVYKLRFKKQLGEGKSELVANGHVRVGIL